MFSDLELDYINPIDLCHRINKLLLPEMIVHFIICAMFLFSLRVVAFVINVPLLLYHIIQIAERRYMLDATEVFRQLPYRKRESMIKLVFYILSFFFYLYSLVAVLIST